MRPRIVTIRYGSTIHRVVMYCYDVDIIPQSQKYLESIGSCFTDDVDITSEDMLPGRIVVAK